MGTETRQLYAGDMGVEPIVKLNNPQMGTET